MVCVSLVGSVGPSSQGIQFSSFTIIEVNVPLADCATVCPVLGLACLPWSSATASVVGGTG